MNFYNQKVKFGDKVVGNKVVDRDFLQILQSVLLLLAYLEEFALLAVDFRLVV